MTTDALLKGADVPTFRPFEGTELYRLGWRFDNAIAADGPGSSLFGIEDAKVHCLVAYQQDASMDEKTGEIVRSDALVMAVQCYRKP